MPNSIGHDPELYQLLGFVCIKQGKYQDALIFFDKAVQHANDKRRYKIFSDFSDAKYMQKKLRGDEELLPLLSAYFKQNKDRIRDDRDD